MYAMYPDSYSEPTSPSGSGTRRDSEWGPAKHDPHDPRSRAAVQAALDLRDSGGQRPDDN
ncbi:hypothetical protein [Nocardioides insulae]|uniref:hypothetical protein n=1 Tax=Nocardioides insulae TaxID=394734 RepID=UPI000408AD3D|nr:hypothetical protein [Nocardioides insulae]